MAPKTKFTREAIIDAAFEIARTEGLDGITTRKVAEQLGSSVAPIYVNFKQLDELKKEVVLKIGALGKQLAAEINSGNPFRDIGLASIRFARDYSVLFRDLVMRPNAYLQSYDEDMGDDLVAMMKGDEQLEGLSHEQLQLLLLQMRIFQTGLSVMVANGLLPPALTEDEMVQLLDSTAQHIVIGMQHSVQPDE